MLRITNELKKQFCHVRPTAGKSRGDSSFLGGVNEVFRKVPKEPVCSCCFGTGLCEFGLRAINGDVVWNGDRPKWRGGAERTYHGAFTCDRNRTCRRNG